MIWYNIYVYIYVFIYIYIYIYIYTYIHELRYPFIPGKKSILGSQTARQTTDNVKISSYFLFLSIKQLSFVVAFSFLF